jgi:hypothetical protein
VALLIGVGITRGPHLRPASMVSRAVDTDLVRPGERRQLQFATPGGTRIIWTFDSDFSVRETMP